jgi:hypothetical protein
VADALPIVIVVVVALAAVAAIVSLVSGRGAYDRIGRGELTFDRDATAPSPEADPFRDAEIRQLLEARNARRAARGDAPLDIDAELAALTRGSQHHDPGLREEVRQLVIARNDRRRRQGKEPLDVEAEIERQLRELT